MVDTHLRFAEAVAAQGKLAVFNEIIGTKIGDASVQRCFAQRITMDNPLQAPLVILTVAGLLELEVVGLGLGAVLTFDVAVREVPPTERQAVTEHRIARGFLVIADGIVAAT